MKVLAEWEQHFDSELDAKCPADLRGRAGALLGVIPKRQDWNGFLAAARESWAFWSSSPDQFPHALLLLYAGLGFYEYEDNRFWPAFSRCLDLNPLTGGQQKMWNDAFEQAAVVRGFRLLHGGSHRSLVGTAVYLAGIPLSMWEDFLNVCEWALRWKEGWEQLPDDAWKERMEHKLGRGRLFLFLTANRETASTFIGEMVAARKLLTENASARLSDAAPNIDRRYLDEVDETADFLRPDNPDSLLDDKPRLLWRERRIAVHLPPVSVAAGKWECSGRSAPASDVAGELPLNGSAFEAMLSVNLQSGDQTCLADLPGIQPYGLFDEQRKRFANLNRTRLPTAAYRLISREQLRIDAKEKDWSIESNEPFELEDATQCYVSHLWPVSDRPELVINGGEPLRFGRREKVNLRIYAGSENSHVLRFGWRGENLMVERLPHLVLEIPCGFLSEEDVSDDDMREEFAVLLDSHAATGSWVPEDHFCAVHWSNAGQTGGLREVIADSDSSGISRKTSALYAS